MGKDSAKAIAPITTADQNAAVMSFLTPCGLERGIQQISLYFLVNNLAVIVSRLTVGRVITYVPKRTCILFGIILCGIGTGLIAVAYNLALMMLSAVLVGVGITAVTQLLQVEVMVAVPSQRRGLPAQSSCSWAISATAWVRRFGARFPPGRAMC